MDGDYCGCMYKPLPIITWPVLQSKVKGGQATLGPPPESAHALCTRYSALLATPPKNVVWDGNRTGKKKGGRGGRMEKKKKERVASVGVELCKFFFISPWQYHNHTLFLSFYSLDDVSISFRFISFNLFVLFRSGFYIWPFWWAFWIEILHVCQITSTYLVPPLPPIFQSSSFALPHPHNWTCVRIIQ